MTTRDETGATASQPAVMTDAVPRASIGATAPEDRVSIPRRFGYAVGDYGINFYWQGLGLFLLFFYTDVLEIPATVAGTVFLVASLWDAVTDPVMGWLAQRTRSRWGSYRPWILFGAVPFAVTFAAIFYQPALGPTATIIYALIAHLLFRTAYTVVSVPYSSLSARLTSDSRERGRVAGFRMYFAILGGLTVAFGADKLVAFYGARGAENGFFLAAITAGFVATAALVICFLSTEEHSAEDGGAAGLDAPDFQEIVAAVRVNKPMQIVVAGVIVSGLLNTFLGKSLLYFFTYNLQAEELRGTALAMLFISGLITLPIWVKVMNAFSKRVAFLICKVFVVVGLLMILIVPTSNPWVIISMLLFASLGSSGLAVTFWAMVPDTVEFGEWKTGVRAESIIFGLMTFAQKASIGLGAFGVGLTLDLIGYAPGEVQSAGTLAGIKFMFAGMPLIGAVATAAIMWFYPIDTRFHGQMLLDIKAAKARASA